MTLSFRKNLVANDVDAIRRLVGKTHVFSAEEVLTAGELVEEALQKGEEASGYSFILAENDNTVLGYSCFGRIPLTQSSYDLYWIAVDPAAGRKGIAHALMQQTEGAISKALGTQIYAETSSTDPYIPARKFYERSGFTVSAHQKDFYRPGDDKVTFVKVL